MSFDLKAARIEAEEYLADRLTVYVRHPAFGYVKSVEGPKATGGKWCAEFDTRPEYAAEWTCSQLRVAQDANGNGVLALLVASYSGLTLEITNRAKSPSQPQINRENKT